MLFEHGGNAVEAEAVEMVFLLPEFQVGKQEMQHLMLGIIEQLGAPGGVIVLFEELILGAVEQIDAVGAIGGGVGMHHVQKHKQAHLVGFIHQIFQIVRIAEPAGGGEKIGHLIAEGGVIRVLHHAHELDGVITGVQDALEGDVGKFPIGADTGLFLGHAHVGFVNIQRGGLAATIAAVGPAEGALGRPHPAAEFVGDRVLNYAVGVEGDAVEGFALAGDLHLIALAMADGVDALDVNFPHAIFQAGEGMTGAIPAVEIPDEVHLIRAGSPFPVKPALGGAGQAEIDVTVGKVVKLLARIQQRPPSIQQTAHAQFDIRGIGFQVRIYAENSIFGAGRPACRHVSSPHVILYTECTKISIANPVALGYNGRAR